MKEESYNSQDCNGWKEWSRYVIKELERLGKKDESIEHSTVDIRIRMESINVKLEKIDTHLKEKGAFWGAIAGVIAALAIELLSFTVKNIL